MPIVRILLAMVALTPLVGAVPGGDDHFLSFSRSETLVASRMEIHVGVRDWPGRKKGELPRAADLWFSGDPSDSATRRPLKWTDGARCPAAVARLREVERLTGPSARIPLAGGEAWGGSVMDGTSYTLDAQFGAWDGQSNGPVHLSSNVNTRLAKWVDAMLDALRPCWSPEKPAGAP